MILFIVTNNNDTIYKILMILFIVTNNNDTIYSNKY